MKKKKQTLVQPAQPTYPMTFETYREIGPREIKSHYLGQGYPDCFNGVVSIRRYKVTIELIDEPVEDLRARLLNLWLTMEYNSHHCAPMWNAAVELGVEDPSKFLRLGEQGRLSGKSR